MHICFRMQVKKWLDECLTVTVMINKKQKTIQALVLCNIISSCSRIHYSYENILCEYRDVIIYCHFNLGVCVATLPMETTVEPSAES